MRHTKLLSATALLLPVLASAQALPPQVVIAFDLISQPVPLTDWLPAVCAVLMAAAAWFLRKRIGPTLRSLVLVASAILAATTVVHMHDANAISTPLTFPITLASSPSTTDITQNIGIATNATGSSIRITGVSVTQASAQSSQSCTLAIVTATTTCNVGSVLASATTCQVEVQCPF